MTATNYTGVKYHNAKNGIRTYYIQYKQNGKVKREKVGTKAEGITPLYCKKLREQKLVQNRLGDDAPATQQTRTNNIMTLDEVATKYFAWAEEEGKRSVSKLQNVYSTHLASLKHEPITAIDSDMIDAFRNKKKRSKSKKTGRMLAPKTVNNMLAVLSAILHYAEEKRYTKSTPKIKKIKFDNTRERFLSVAEINALYQEIEDSALRTKDRVLLFAKVALTTGARLGSVLSIQGKDINRTNRTVALKNHKTDNTYTGFLPQSLLDEIPPLKPQEYLIDVSDEKQIQRPLQGILDKLFNQGLKAEDRKDRVVVHTLRHTFASHLAINGTPIQTIMKLMDHSDIKMTLRYAKLMPNSGQEDVEALYG